MGVCDYSCCKQNLTIESDQIVLRFIQDRPDVAILFHIICKTKLTPIFTFVWFILFMFSKLWSKLTNSKHMQYNKHCPLFLKIHHFQETQFFEVPQSPLVTSGRQHNSAAWIVSKRKVQVQKGSRLSLCTNKQSILPLFISFGYIACKWTSSSELG